MLRPKKACNKNNKLWKKKKEIILLTNEESQSYHEQGICYICRGTAHNICNLRCKTPKEIPVVFHNGSKYDYHFLIKELAEEFKGQF